jgi:hypothetical protein
MTSVRVFSGYSVAAPPLTDSTDYPVAQRENSPPRIATRIATASNSGVFATVRRRPRNYASRARIGVRRTCTDPFDDTGGQVVAGSNPVSPTKEHAG